MRVIPAFILALGVSLVMSACQASPPSSRTKIDSGEFITANSKNRVPAVVKVHMTTGQGTNACTATAVSDNTLLLAAHCVNSNMDGQGKISGLNLCIVSGDLNNTCTGNVYIPTAFKQPDMSKDVAIAIFPAGTFKHVAALRSQRAQISDEILFVGYSEDNADQSQLQTNGSKRWGRNTIASLDRDSEGTLPVITSIYRGSRDGVAVSPGDSGGPIFTSCQVVGVASRMDGDGAGKVSIHTDLTQPFNHGWLMGMRKMGAEFCGTEGADASKCASLSIMKPGNAGGSEFPCESQANSGGDNGTSQDNGAATLGVFEQSNSSFVVLSAPSSYGNVSACVGSQADSCDSDLGLNAVSQQGSNRQFFRVSNNVLSGGRTIYITLKAKNQAGDGVTSSFKLTPQ